MSFKVFTPGVGQLFVFIKLSTFLSKLSIFSEVESTFAEVASTFAEVESTFAEVASTFADALSTLDDALSTLDDVDAACDAVDLGESFRSHEHSQCHKGPSFLLIPAKYLQEFAKDEQYFVPF